MGNNDPMGSNQLDNEQFTWTSLVLKQKPCVVQYFEVYDKFLVGTYQLASSIEERRHAFPNRSDAELEEIFEKLNGRVGSLFVIGCNKSGQPKIEYHFDCFDGGGVFDLTISTSCRIHVAHSNGVIGQYIWEQEVIKSSESHIQLDSKLLTSIDLNKSTIEGRLIAVGDSDGYLTVIAEEKVVSRLQIDNVDSIWQTKFLSIPSMRRDFIIVGAENSSWYLYELDKDTKSLILLHKNSDFTAGVTSFSLSELSSSRDASKIQLYVGSYDESLRSYTIDLVSSSVHTCCSVSINKGRTFKVPGGGIWRLKRFHQDGQSVQLNIAAMYAGSYSLVLNDQIMTEDNSENLITIKKGSDNELHYDIDTSSNGNIYCIVDFNKSLCLFRTKQMTP